MHLELFKDKNSKYRIRLRASNGRILMSSEAYASKRNAKDTIVNIEYFTKRTGLKIVDKTK